VDGLAGYLPIFIQIASSALFELLQEQPEGDVDLHAIRSLFREEAEPHFRFLWTSIEEEQRHILRCLALNRVLPPAFDHVKLELRERGYVRMRSGQDKLFSDAFEQFVRIECRGAGAGELPQRGARGKSP
jgi:hypothetical protein